MENKNFFVETTQKESLFEENKPKSWLKTVSAFANTVAGNIVFGIDDDNNLFGIENIEYTIETIKKFIEEKLDPVPEVDIKVIVENDKKLIDLSVKHGNQTPYYYLGDRKRLAFVRIGNQSVEVDDITLKQLVLNGIHKSFDSLLTEYRSEDYGFITLNQMYKYRTGLILDREDLISFGLMNQDGILTNAGELFSDSSTIYQSRIFCTRWYGNTKASGLIEAIDDAEYSGSILTLLDYGLKFIKRNVKHPWRKTNDYRMEMHDYPELAIKEVLINALIHRDYSQYGSEIHIDIFDDRMEIYSPGGMYDGSIVQDLDLKMVPSVRRNPIIADVFSRMSLMERRGTGFKKIIEYYKRAPNFRKNLLPKFYSTHSTFIATLFNLNFGRTIEDIAIESTLKYPSDDLLFDIEMKKYYNSGQENNSIRNNDGKNNRNSFMKKSNRRKIFILSRKRKNSSTLLHTSIV